MSGRACVVGAGPNGLAAAIALVQRGAKVEVFEAEAEPGGAVRTMELTLPGFLHDFGSAIHPFAAGSPFFSSLPLREHGLEWVHSPSVLAHPFDDGTAIVLERDLKEASAALGADGKAWRWLVGEFAARWSELAEEVFGPMPLLPKRPFLMARFGLVAFPPARILAGAMFRNARTKAMFAGMAAHSFLSLDEPLSAAFGVLMGAAAHAVGWPFPKGGAGALTKALCGVLASLGGSVKVSTPISNLDELGECDVTLCDVAPGALARMAGKRLTAEFTGKLARYQHGPGAFKVDYALSEPIPWKAKECARAATIHLGGSMEEIAASEAAMRRGEHSERPFVLLAQPSLFDSTRAPAGKHTAWAYCHVPNGSTVDMLPLLEKQIERFAPGFLECVLARRVFSPAGLQAMDANLVGGDISGGAMNVGQMLFRPTWRHYATTADDIFLCSASTPPGGGVHGMCGYHGAQRAARRLTGISTGTKR
jgi:phytoene dehydrogenase-like protein